MRNLPNRSVNICDNWEGNKGSPNMPMTLIKVWPNFKLALKFKTVLLNNKSLDTWSENCKCNWSTNVDVKCGKM